MSGLLNVLTLGVLPALNYLGARETNKTNIKLAKQGQAFEEKMWNKNNLYNSPLQQMSRLQQAGLNPNLIYGNGSSSTGLSSSYPRAHVATVTNEMQNLTSGVLPALSLYQDMKVKDAQIQQMNNNSDLILQKTINESFRGNLMKSQTELAQANAQRVNTLLPYSTKAMEANIDKMRLSNKDMLFKLNQLNPKILEQMGLKNQYVKNQNRAMDFDYYHMLPKKVQALSLQNQLSKQSLSDLNPSLLELRMLQKNMMQLNYNMESKLNPYNMTSKDNLLFRLIPGLFEDSPKRKDVLFKW